MGKYEIVITETQAMGMHSLKLMSAWRGDIVFITDDGKSEPTFHSSIYFQSDDPDKRRTRGGLLNPLGRYRRYYTSTGKRWEVEERERRNAKERAKRAAAERAKRVRDAAPDLLAALRGLVVGRDMTVSHAAWPEVQAALVAIAKAEGAPE